MGKVFFNKTKQIQQGLLENSNAFLNLNLKNKLVLLLTILHPSKEGLLLMDRMRGFLYPPIVIILLLFECNFGSCNFLSVSIPPRTLNFASTAFLITGSIDFPSRKVVSKSDSEAENKQFLIFPFAVKRNLLHESQNGFVTELITPKLPW